MQADIRLKNVFGIKYTGYLTLKVSELMKCC